MIDQLSSKISPETTGILWFCNQPTRGDIFHYFNYLLDGLLEKANIIKNPSNKNLFISKNYELPLFLGIIKEDGINEAREILALIPDQKKKVLLVNSKSETVGKLKKSFPTFSFETISTQ